MNAAVPEVQLDDLYQEVILDHNRRPRNFGKIEGTNFYSHGFNPLCGDDYHLYLFVDKDGVIGKVGFEGQGCAISKSSASMMTEAVQDKPLEEVRQLKERFLLLLTGGESEAQNNRNQVGKLKIFEGVKKFPVRVKCATLAWHALADALKDFENKKGDL